MSQRESVFYDGTFPVLLHNLYQLSSDASVENISLADESTQDVGLASMEQDEKFGQDRTTTKKNQSTASQSPSHIVRMFKVVLKRFYELRVRELGSNSISGCMKHFISRFMGISLCGIHFTALHFSSWYKKFSLLL